MKLSIVIPAYNEARTIQAVLDRISEAVGDFHEIVVVDDASSDETAELVRKRVAGDSRIRLLQHERNSGKTAALRTGFAATTGDLVVIQDADLEYDPADIPDLIAPILENRGDVSLGSRFMIKRAGRVLYYRHYLANKFLTFLSNVLTDLNCTDVETGYKAMRSEVAKRLIIESTGFGFEVEFIAKCKKAGYRLFEVPINYFGRTYEEGKKITFLDGLAAIYFILKFNLFATRANSFRKEEFGSSGVQGEEPGARIQESGGGNAQD
ncbi:MAG TPA: glycosyltransferase family 2 protein [Chthoniobacterales bacterium]|jgi:glycosyltransferase involved in cell wall biosynthesis|nr:glycosyltransferase family 2 protein [Chthoniobacterales bacterium]